MSENEHDLVYDLSDRKYWDIKHSETGYCIVTTRMEYDKATCEKIIELVIRALRMEY